MEDIWNKGERFDFKESEIKICGDDRVRLTTKKENIKGYKLKYELSCIDENGIASKQYFYEKDDVC